MNLALTRSLRDLRHVAILAAAAIVAIIAAVVILRTGGGSSSSAQRAEGAAAMFGLGRSTIDVTPFATVSGALQVPDGVDEDSVTYTIKGGEGADQVNVSGDGPEFVFDAPNDGEVELRAIAKLHGDTITARTTFYVGEPTTFAGTDVSTKGTVLVNGGPAVAGEALAPHAKIDATEGEITYLARASSDGATAGRVTFSGTEFEVSYEVQGQQVLNTVDVTRDGTRVKKLSAKVEHLSNQRYVAVQTPDAVAMVKGTEFDVTVRPGSSEVEVDVGVVHTADRFRYYVAPQDITADERMSFDAVEPALAAELMSEAMHGGSDAVTRHAPVREAEADAAVLESEDGIIDEIVADVVREVAPPPIRSGPGGGGTGDAGDTTSPDPGTGTTDPGTTDPGTGGTTDGTSGSTGGTNTDTTYYGGGGGDTGTSGGGSTGTTEPPPAPRPPASSNYRLEAFEEYGFARCLTTHVLWNGNYGDSLAEHVCVPRSALDGIFHEQYGYPPLAGWGCMRLHAVWRHDTSNRPTWCYPVAQSIVDGLRVYEPPMMWDRRDNSYATMTCSDGHRLTLGLCRPL